MVGELKEGLSRTGADGGAVMGGGDSCYIWGMCGICMGQIESLVRSFIEAKNTRHVHDVPVRSWNVRREGS